MELKNCNIYVGEKLILENINFKLGKSEKIVILGNNGSGKSVLLKALTNKLNVNKSNKSNLINSKYNSQNQVYIIEGDVKNLENVYLFEQEIPLKYQELTILEYLRKITGIEEIQLNLDKSAENYEKLTEKEIEAYSLKLQEFIEKGGYIFEAELEKILKKLNFKHDLNTKISELSGGEKTKTIISGLMLSMHDLVFLDEVTNNLDIDTIEVLEEYILNSTKKMLIVSHDKTFLKKINPKVLEIKDGKVINYNTDYNSYEIYKVQEYNKQKREYFEAKEEKVRLVEQIKKNNEFSKKGKSKLKSHTDNDKILRNSKKERQEASQSKNKVIKNKIEKIEEKIKDGFTAKKKIEYNIKESKENDLNKEIVLHNLICGYKNYATQEINQVISYGDKVHIKGENGSRKNHIT